MQLATLLYYFYLAPSAGAVSLPSDRGRAGPRRNAEWLTARAPRPLVYRLRGATGQFQLTGSPAELVHDERPGIQRDDEEWLLLTTEAA